MDNRTAELLFKAKGKLTNFIAEELADEGRFDSLRNFVIEAAVLAFGMSSRERERIAYALQPDFDQFGDVFPGGYLNSAERTLEVIDSIEEIYLELHTYDSELAAGIERVAHASNKKVFVVHGHDDALRERVARFLERASLQPVILAEQPSGGNTIIEKLESNSDVAFAVVLLTGDDVGGASADELQPRARQNVVFELGYFVGLLARKRVCALVEEGVEIFSDISGVTYISVDPAGAWKNQLAKELNAAKLQIDLAALL